MLNLKRLRYRAHRTRLNAPLIWLRHRGLDSRDVFLASYPRSGQHWARFQLFEILTKQSADFDSLDNTIPKLGDHAKAPSILTFGGRLVQTHEPWHKEYAKAILLVRDCRDVVLSDYAWDESLDLIKHFDIRNFDDYLLPWLKGRVQTMGTWQDHTKSWLDSPLAKSENLLLVSFEEMRSNTEDMLAKMAQFLDVPVDRAIIRNVIANNTLDKMRAKEDASKRYAPQRLGRKTGEEHRFVRKGSVGGWRERMTEVQLRLIDQYAGAALLRLGYPLGSSFLPNQTTNQHGSVVSSGLSQRNN